MLSHLTASPLVYRLWQRPFLWPKLKPFLEHPDFLKAKNLVELGCGAGLNRPFFGNKDYVGIDINDAYIKYAQRRFGAKFEVGDITGPPLVSIGKFDLVLIHSVQHHLDDRQVEASLRFARALLKPEAHIHIFDVVMPLRFGLAQLLARADHGAYIRPWELWRDLLNRNMTICEEHWNSLKLFGMPAYSMFHIVGY